MTNLAIEARGLRKSFGDHLVLDSLDLAMPEGTVFALIGPDGSGKTTTVWILSAILPADAGVVTVAGHDLGREPGAVREVIGVTGQFSAVDNPRSRRTMWEIVRELAATGVTIFLTTQQLDEADQLADHIAVLDRGRLVGEGTPEELKRRRGGGAMSTVTPPSSTRCAACSPALPSVTAPPWPSAGASCSASSAISAPAPATTGSRPGDREPASATCRPPHRAAGIGAAGIGAAGIGAAGIGAAGEPPAAHHRPITLVKPRSIRPAKALTVRRPPVNDRPPAQRRVHGAAEAKALVSRPAALGVAAPVLRQRGPAGVEDYDVRVYARRDRALAVSQAE
jgi:ABC transporter